MSREFGIPRAWRLGPWMKRLEHKNKINPCTVAQAVELDSEERQQVGANNLQGLIELTNDVLRNVYGHTVGPDNIDLLDRLLSEITKYAQVHRIEIVDNVSGGPIELREIVEDLALV